MTAAATPLGSTMTLGLKGLGATGLLNGELAELRNERAALQARLTSMQNAHRSSEDSETAAYAAAAAAAAAAPSAGHRLAGALSSSSLLGDAGANPAAAAGDAVRAEALTAGEEERVALGPIVMLSVNALAAAMQSTG